MSEEIKLTDTYSGRFEVWLFIHWKDDWEEKKRLLSTHTTHADADVARRKAEAEHNHDFRVKGIFRIEVFDRQLQEFLME